MNNLIQNAKDLIKKGKKLGDPELIQMGMDLLDQYSDDSPEYVVTQTKAEPARYICSYCGNIMEYDKPNRKRCSQCKKHELVLHKATVVPEESPEAEINPNRVDTEDFTVQIRNNQSGSRVRFNEQGQPEGTYSRAEQIEGVANIWQDDGVEENDAANETLKKFTKVSPRLRKPAKKIEVTCISCHSIEYVHPIHAAGGRSRHLCAKCIRKRSRF